jgi:hypothetical protein
MPAGRSLYSGNHFEDVQRLLQKTKWRQREQTQLSSEKQTPSVWQATWSLYLASFCHHVFVTVGEAGCCRSAKTIQVHVLIHGKRALFYPTYYFCLALTPCSSPTIYLILYLSHCPSYLLGSFSLYLFVLLLPSSFFLLYSFFFLPLAFSYPTLSLAFPLSTSLNLSLLLSMYIILSFILLSSFSLDVFLFLPFLSYVSV